MFTRWFHRHRWETTAYEGQRLTQECSVCGRERSMLCFEGEKEGKIYCKR